MTYEEFKINLTEMVTNLAGEEADVTVHKVPKNNNVILDAVTIMNKGSYIAPTIYIEDLYSCYENGAPMEEIAEKIVEFSKERHLNSEIPDDFFMVYEKMKGRVCYRLINYEKNQKLLKEIPHKKFLDLAVIYYYLIEPSLMANASVLIRNEDMERLGVTQEILHEDAMKNTPCLLPYDFMSIREMMEDLLKRSHPNAVLKQSRDDVSPMHVLTNSERFLGAACILYPHVLEKIAEHFNSHFYILPSSIHECILMPVSEAFSQESLSNMVAEINDAQLEEIEVLSDHAYFYDRNTKKITF